jgi:hypothetical protein
VVAVEPRGTGIALFMLRAADEVRAAQFGGVERDLDAEMVAIAGAIIGRGSETAFRGGSMLHPWAPSPHVAVLRSVLSRLARVRMPCRRTSLVRRDAIGAE